MKPTLLLTKSLLLLSAVPWVALSEQLSFQRPFRPNPIDEPSMPPQNSDILTPYTMAWVNELQAIFNAFGVARNTSECPTKIPEWDCRPYELTKEDLIPPSSVWRLRPHDIKAVISIGDSITAGFAMVSARPPFATVLEFRGKVFSDGGDEGEYTIANFLKTYTSVRGSPSGFTLPLAFGKGLNTAVSGAVAQQLHTQIDRLRRSFRFGGLYHRYKKEWKLATVFIGANNLCAACGPGEAIPAIADPEAYGAALKSALLELKDAVGPTFVNLVGIFDVSLVYELSRGYPYCEMLFDKVPLPICGCATGNEDTRKKAGDLAKEYNNVMERIAREVNDASQDIGTFGVAYQPGLTEFKDGASPYGQGYMSGLDCFHPNKCANQVMAISIWNNMFSSSVDKNTPMKPSEVDIYCPGRSDYFQ